MFMNFTSEFSFKITCMRLTFFSLFATLFLSTLFFADLFGQERTEDEEAARKVFEEMEDRRAKINYETARLEMIIHDPRGRTRTRVIQSYSYNDENQSKSLLLFESPGSVRGTGFLSISDNGDDVQRLYLPDVGRIQAISPAERGDRFMGSDFTYEDLASQDPDDFEFLWMETDEEYYLIRARHLRSRQYDQVSFVILREKYTPEIVEYLDDKGEVIRRLEAEQFDNLYEDVWSSLKMTMYDLKEGRKTELVWENRTINDPIPDWRFTERGLQRGLN